MRQSIQVETRPTITEFLLREQRRVPAATGAFTAVVNNVRLACKRIAHAIGQGAVIWVFISEIFPNSVRAAGTSFGSLTHWAWATIITLVFPYFAGNPHIGGAKIFGFFAVMMVLQLLYVWKMMPETKGVALEDMDKTTLLHV